MSESTVQGGLDAAAGAAPRLALLGSTFVIAACGLVYELVAGALSSYLLGDSIYQFSLVIGLFMAAMGLGSYLSRHVGEALVEVFVTLQVAVGVVGGLSALGLFYAFTFLDTYTPFLVLSTVVVGALIGVEIPVVIRLLRRYQTLRVNVSNVLTVDYLGALVAALAFPLVLVPQLGLVRTGLFFGLLNVGVAALALWTFRAALPRVRALVLATAGAALLLGVGLAGAGQATGFFEHRLYGGEIVLARTTPYQRIVLTRSGPVLNLYLNGALQFSSLDEYRYHEALVHPAMTLAHRRDRVLILGGGDGLALREVLRHPDVGQVTLVDLDPEMTRLFSTHALLQDLNAGAFDDPRVRVLNADAWKHLEAEPRRNDVIIVDLPDPHDVNLSRLYSRGFYALAARRLAADGVLVTQATSPMFAREAFWSIAATLAGTPAEQRLDATLFAVPYHAYVPSFGDWGFVLASPRRLSWSDVRPGPAARFLSPEVIRTMTTFAPDTGPIPVEENTLAHHPLVRYYETGWARWYE